MLATISPEQLATQIAEDVYQQASKLSQELGARLGKPRAPRIADDVRMLVLYAQQGAELPNPVIVEAIDRVIDVLASTCYEPATPVARQLFDRKAGEPEADIERVLLAARARWDIELGLDVPIRWLAVLGGVSVKTARNLASDGRLATHTKREGQVASAIEAARWLRSRGIVVAVGARRVSKPVPFATTRARGTRGS